MGLRATPLLVKERIDILGWLGIPVYDRKAHFEVEEVSQMMQDEEESGVRIIIDLELNREKYLVFMKEPETVIDLIRDVLIYSVVSSSLCLMLIKALGEKGKMKLFDIWDKKLKKKMKKLW